ncbi:hypothetical protein ACHAXT_003485 [Thalassiosira profunda]
MADEQTGDFFAPPADDAAFAAPPAGGEDGNVGDVYYGTEAEAGAADFAAPPAEDAPIILGDPAPAEDAAFAAPGVVEDVEEEEAPTTLVAAEPGPMAKWNEEWQATLLARKEEENAQKASDVEKAREEIEKFQAEREKRREARMAKNRTDEQDKLEAIEADLENDNSWQRSVKMIELNQESGEASADTGRMKDVLVMLKNEPARAEALGA